jgi:hypothetical protein
MILIAKWLFLYIIIYLDGDHDNECVLEFKKYGKGVETERYEEGAAMAAP